MLHEITKRYQLKDRQFVCIGGFYNHVFSNGSHVVKVFHENQAKSVQMEHEINVMTYMNQRGIPSASVFHSNRQRTFEEIMYCGERYFCFVQSRIEGETIAITDLSGGNIAEWSAQIGAIHHAGKAYSHYYPLNHWHEESIVQTASIVLDDTLQAVWLNVYKKLTSLTQDDSSYGLIHHDLHHENIRFLGNKASIIDFESTIQHWYIYDLAIAIYHASLHIEKDKRADWYEWFSSIMLEGYQSTFSLEKKWVDELSFFIYYRQWYSYLYFQVHLEKNEQVTQMLEKMKSYLAAEKTII
ncbi:phosphotransferase enzyme family protein [Shouchella miscanthi]|uniref:Phosphotransferase n=1 Tax=Shouchella miscanthi TaxID=2598861 RepID=A0ABU6NTS8_9BACI|nr:phosphotransferase [Shouchella miscanthi]